jgi:hypothetical protein
VDTVAGGEKVEGVDVKGFKTSGEEAVHCMGGERQVEREEGRQEAKRRSSLLSSPSSIPARRDAVQCTTAQTRRKRKTVYERKKKGKNG